MTVVAVPQAAYTDIYLNALTAPHHIAVKAEVVWSGGTTEVALISGSVTADRSAVVRRTASIEVDPTQTPHAMTDMLTPYGNKLNLYRGIRYPDQSVDLTRVFTGRIEQVDSSPTSVSVSATDYAAEVVDAKFEQPYRVGSSVKITDAMKQMLLDVNPAWTINVTATSTQTTVRAVAYEEERADALTTLGQQIGAEWFADMNGVFYIQDLFLTIPSGVTPNWIVDTGATGVMVGRATSLTRTGIANSIVVVGESLNGIAIYGHWKDTDPTSVTRYGGPFGKVTQIIQGQNIASQPQADAAAQKLGQRLVASAKSIDIECVPNPRLQIGHVIQVIGSDFDGMYFVNGLTLPMDPESTMKISAATAILT